MQRFKEHPFGGDLQIVTVKLALKLKLQTENNRECINLRFGDKDERFNRNFFAGLDQGRLEDEVAQKGYCLEQVRFSRGVGSEDACDGVYAGIRLGGRQENVAVCRASLGPHNKLHEGFLLKGSKVPNRQRVDHENNTIDRFVSISRFMMDGFGCLESAGRVG